MNVAAFYTTLATRGGAERVLLEWARRTTHDVDIYTLHYAPELTYDAFEDLHIISLMDYVPRAPKAKIREIIRRTPDLSNYDALLVFTEGYAEHIIHNANAPFIFLYAHTPLRRLLPEEQPSSRSIAGRIYRGITNAVLHVMSKHAWHRARVQMFNSRKTKERAERLHLVKEPARVVPPGVDLPRDADVTYDDFVLYVSRFDENKRQVELLEAWKRVRTEYTLVLAGATSNLDYYEKVASLAQEIRNVEIVPDPTDKELAELYAACAAGVYIPWNEDYGLVPLEFLAYGKPILITRTAGVVDHIISRRVPIHTLPDSRDRDVFVRELVGYLRAFLSRDFEEEGRQILSRRWILPSWDDFAGTIDGILEGYSW